MAYTNILQSIVVVPGIRHNGLTFEEMTQKIFAFNPLKQADWMKIIASCTDILIATGTGMRRGVFCPRRGP